MDPRISGASPVNPQSLKNLQKAAEEQELRQEETSDNFEQWCEFDAFNPMAMIRTFRPIEELIKTRQQQQSDKKEKVEGAKVIEVQQVEEAAARFQRNNDELQAKTLLILRSRLTPKDTPDEILDKIFETYPDYAIADEALDFLLETASSEMLAAIRIAKQQLNSRYEREIKAGRNMGAQAREFSKEGLGSPTSLRDMYRDITGTAREPLALFNELSDKFPYSKLKTAIHFLLHSLGSDLRSKGSSIPRGELKRLIDETRNLQGILGIYRFFQSRMDLIGRQFASYQIAMPSRLDFEIIAKQFVKFLAERFMSPDKILQASRMLGISEEAIAQMIIFTQMRDAIKQIAPRYYRNQQQRDELTNSFHKALDDLEDKLEEEEEAKEREKNEKKKK